MFRNTQSQLFTIFLSAAFHTHGLSPCWQFTECSHSFSGCKSDNLSCRWKSQLISLAFFKAPGTLELSPKYFVNLLGIQSNLTINSLKKQLCKMFLSDWTFRVEYNITFYCYLSRNNGIWGTQQFARPDISTALLIQNLNRLFVLSYHYRIWPLLRHFILSALFLQNVSHMYAWVTNVTMSQMGNWCQLNITLMENLSTNSKILPTECFSLSQLIF